jgi:hypothetical protein
MFKLLRLGIIFTSVLALCFIFACTGDQGPQGPEGPPGEPGEPGQDLSIAPPEDVYLSVAVFNQFNGFDVNYRSQDFVLLTFDSTATPSANVIVGTNIGKSPIIDGIDGDIDEWGIVAEEILNQSEVTLGSFVGDDNMITQVTMRCVYDARYIYFFLAWSEDVTGDFLEEENRNLQEWENDGVDAFTPLTVGSEDRVWMMFVNDPAYVPSGDDCLLDCGLENASFSSNLKIDAWDWRACLTDLVGFSDDGYLDYQGGNLSGFVGDAGGAAFMRNIEGTLPAWMYYTDPNSNGSYPFWFRFAVTFVNSDWSRGSTIPGYMALIPYGDRADIIAASSFETPRWVVEMRRLRNTGNGNDVQF